MKYIKEDVEKMLIEHPKNEAKLTEVELKLEEYQQRLEYEGTRYEDTSEEVIEAMQLSGQAYDSIPSNTNKVSDKIANVAMNYHKQEKYINKEDRFFLKTKINEYQNIKDTLDKKIVRVKNLLNQLSEDEEFVVRKYYMKKAKWDYVENQYLMEYKKPKSIKQLQAYRDNALKSMLEILNI